MKAIILEQAGDNPQLHIQEIPVPTIDSGEVLIEVKAISINPVDVKTSNGKGAYGKIKDENPIIIGWDISGVVTESKSDEYDVGQEVFGMVNFPGHGKAYAEYVAAPASQLALKPQNITHAEAAATTLAALTAYQSLLKTGSLTNYQKVLVHAASGGVGHFAVQIARLFGANVTGTSSDKNRDFVLQLGADTHIDYHTSALENGPKDYDLVLDTIGGDNIDRSLPLIKKGGIIISIPSGANDHVVEKAAANGVQGFTFMVSSNGDDMKVLAGFLEHGTIKPHVSQNFSFQEISKAFEQVQSGRTIGKVVILL